ncbi:MAG: cation transporter [Ruminococcaceae bacterium]|nr:cation transporter [Oscillospiraceae bacterium]
MISLLSRWFISDHQNYTSPKVREGYGVLCGTMGIALNVLLFLVKLAGGLFSGSIAIMADAFNNLADAGSSVMTMLGFKLAGRKPDPEHPFGHGRMEYISGLLVALMILLMAFELIKGSVQKIMSPDELNTSPWVIVLLAVSILVKLYMSVYNRRIAKLISSSAMKATAADCLNDCISTGAVLLSTVIAAIWGVNLDAWCGLAVGLFILYSGIKMVFETAGDLMGKAPEPELVDRIQQIVLEDEHILGVHDLIVHDYGPGRMIISLHAEVPASGDILAMHDLIDNIENRLRSEFSCVATIHMDPICDDEATTELRIAATKIVQDIDERLTVHDFRMVTGPTHTNLIFDVVAPFRLGMSDAQLHAAIDEAVAVCLPHCRTVVSIDKDYNGVSGRQ